MRIIDWGQIDYSEAVDKQLQLVEEVSAGAEDALVICTHPPVVTLGRSSKEYDMLGWDGAVFESSRGGRATYHGPNQIVLYPIINLDKEDRLHLGKRDLHGYLRLLEQAVISVLAKFDVQAVAKSDKTVDEHGNPLEVTGVWVGENKIASIGIAVKKWVTYHGVAINVLEDAQAFSGINPCGFRKSVMTNLQAVSGQDFSNKKDRQALQNLITSTFGEVFS